MRNNLTIADIHKIRQENHEQTKHLSNDELLKRTEQKAASGWQRIADIKKQQSVNVAMPQ